MWCLTSHLFHITSQRIKEDTLTGECYLECVWGSRGFCAVINENDLGDGASGVEPLHPVCALIDLKRVGAPLPTLNPFLSLSSPCRCQCRWRHVHMPPLQGCLCRDPIKDYNNIIYMSHFIIIKKKLCRKMFLIRKMCTCLPWLIIHILGIMESETSDQSCGETFDSFTVLCKLVMMRKFIMQVMHQ